jgi:hypothetical protein
MKKRKLSDLKENECVKVNTKREAKIIIKKLDFQSLFVSQLVGNYIIGDGESFFRIDSTSLKDVKGIDTYLKASDFIKPKKSKVKKLSKKVDYLMDFVSKIPSETSIHVYVLSTISDVMVDYDRRICLLESMRPSEDTKDYLTEMKFGDLETLPNEWCVKYTPENLEILERWRGNRDILRFYSKQDISELSEGYLSNNKWWTRELTYTEISFDDFKRLVLKGETAHETDWNKPGQLVIDHLGNIIMTNGKWAGSNFEGTVINNASLRGFFMENFEKAKCKLYTKEITLKNI